MKARFSSLDLAAIVAQLQDLVGLRLSNVYDVDSKTYILKLVQAPRKAMLIFESGIRIHTTSYDWPKNNSPSGFAMKCRKHLRARRLTAVFQVGTDRIVDLAFGSGEACYHLIIELYDRGNVVLADHQFVILSLLRVRSDEQDVRFAVGERYPIEQAQKPEPPTLAALQACLAAAKPADQLRKALISLSPWGPACLEHCLLEAEFPAAVRVSDVAPAAGAGGESRDAALARLLTAVRRSAAFNEVLGAAPAGVILLKTQARGAAAATPTAAAAGASAAPQPLTTFEEFHPFHFLQHRDRAHRDFDTFDHACDAFFSEIEGQKLDLKALALEQAALQKLENVKKSHEQRLTSLKEAQSQSEHMAELIEANLALVDNAIRVINSYVAASVPWPAIKDLVAEATELGDPVASHIVKLDLAHNSITLALEDPQELEDSGSDDLASDYDSEDEEKVAADARGRAAKKAAAQGKPRATKIDIDLGVTAYANAARYHGKKKHAREKEGKTVEASRVALKSAAKSTAQALKEVGVTLSVTRARKQYWFERFIWFVSSENYLVIGGRDRQQNELVVRRYLQKDDLYVHADLHGASSVVVKNPSGGPVPPRTLLEAGTLAVMHSAAWEAKVIADAWWVHADQVSKSAPAGEYLTSGSFMIRGKKNFVSIGQLALGFGVLFKVDESCIPAHLHERRPNRTLALSADDTAVAEEEEETGEGAASNTSSNSSSASEDEGEGENEDKAPPSAFPDTAIDLVYSRSDSTGLRTQLSVGSVASSNTEKDGNAAANEDDEDDAGDAAKGEDADATAAAAAAAAKKGYLSAKQRRELKKGGSGSSLPAPPPALPAAEAASDSDASDGETEAEATTQKPAKGAKGKPAAKGNGKPPAGAGAKAAAASQQQQQQQQQPKRGQHGKLKKIKEKYDDQDEEERALVMTLLQPQSAHAAPLTRKEKRQHRKDAKVSSRGARVATGAQGLAVPEDRLAELIPQLAATTLEAGRAAAAQRRIDSGDKDGAEVAAAEAAERAEVERILLDENVQLLDEDEQQSLTYLDALTGAPRADDVLLFALPVCAPLSALAGYKYCVKLVPGTSKKGKCAKQAQHIFETLPSTLARERDLLHAMKDEEMTRNLPGKVKLMGMRAAAPAKGGARGALRGSVDSLASIASAATGTAE